MSTNCKRLRSWRIMSRKVRRSIVVPSKLWSTPRRITLFLWELQTSRMQALMAELPKHKLLTFLNLLLITSMSHSCSLEMTIQIQLMQVTFSSKRQPWLELKSMNMELKISSLSNGTTCQRSHPNCNSLEEVTSHPWRTSNRPTRDLRPWNQPRTLKLIRSLCLNLKGSEHTR